MTTTTFPTLYRRTATGALQQWSIVVADDSFTTTEGQVGGVLTTSRPTRCVAKNLGRSNATTPTSQAIKEAQAKWQKKLDAGYVEAADRVDAPLAYLKPMLAQSYDPSKPLPFPVYCQPKLDGVRCIARRDGLWSRYGKRFVSCRHIEAALAPIFVKAPELVLDGELYNHALHDDFNAIISHVKTQKPSVESRAACEATVQYHVYDCPSAAGSILQRLSTAWQWVDDVHPAIVCVDTHHVEDLPQLDAYYDEFLDEGYEGQMIRLPGDYEANRRSRTLLKRKSFIDGEFVLRSVVEGQGNRAGMMGALVFEFGDGRLFEAGARGSHELFREMWEHQERFVGRKATVRYQNLTPAGVPRCGRMIAFRDYE